MLHSSVRTPFPTLRDVFLVAPMNAHRRVWVQSPYFVPDEPLITAMCVAAASGIDVRLMMTGVPDKKVPFHAAHAYFAKVLEAGVTVYTYDAGFLHSKTVTVDDEPIATANAERYERDISSCSEVTSAELSRLTGRQRLRNSVCRLLSRLL